MTRDPVADVCLVLLVFALIITATVGTCESTASAETPATWTADEVAIARLTVSEASFGGGSDARVITWIVAHAAERRGLTPAEYVAQVHHRHTRSERRPWLAGLDETMREPAGWPGDVAWATGAAAWERRLSDVRRYMADDRHGCDGQPVTWSAPTHTRGLQHWQARGYSILRCGRTVNAIVGRAGR